MEAEETYLLKHFPLPPTDNHAYLTLRNGIRVLSAENRAFKKEVEAWAWANQRDIKAIRAICSSTQPLIMDIALKMQRRGFYTASGSIKKMDASNRLKCSVDEICKLLGVDDSVIFSLSITKTLAIEEGLDIAIQHFYPFA